MLIKTGCGRVNQSVRLKQDADLPTPISLANEGMGLKTALHNWEVTAYEWTPATPSDQQMTIAWLFYAAISIYLSGIYDYSRLWTENGIITPALTPSVVDHHLLSILDITSFAVQKQNLAGVLFLFPLRIAGARAYKTEQRDRIRSLLMKIAASFRAANAFLIDLEVLWTDPKSYHNRQ